MISPALLGVNSDVWVPLLAAFLAASGAAAYNYRLIRRQEKRELRALVRLMDNELRQARGILSNLERTVKDGNQLLEFSAMYVPDDRVWRDHQAVLGRHLETDAEWDRLRVAYQRMAIISQAAQISPKDADRTRKWIQATLATIDSAIAVCERHAGKQHSAADGQIELEQSAFVVWQQKARGELMGSHGARPRGREGDP